MKVTPEKASIIKFLKSEGCSGRDIAKRVCVSESAVRATLLNMERALSHRSRRAKVDTVKKRRQVVVAIAREARVEKIKGRKVVVGKAFPALGDIAKEFLKRRKVTVARATVSRDLRASGFTSKVRPRVVNNDPVKNKARLLFCQQIRRDKVSSGDVLFSDECWVNDNDNTNRREWTESGASPTPRCYQKRPEIKLMVWGAIGVGYKSPLVFLDDSVTASVYQKTVIPIAAKSMKASKKRFFMQDNARPHTAKTTMKLLEQLKLNTLNWPAHSPHLNPIERLWNIMHERIAALRPKTEAALRSCALKVWREFDQASIDVLVKSFEASVKRSVDNKGQPW